MMPVWDEYHEMTDEELEQIARVQRARLCKYGCDPDVWGPDGLERGDGHNPNCPTRMRRRFVGGPLDGQTILSRGDIIELAAHPGMAYHWTQDHSVPPPDPDWWMKGLPEPQPRERVYEWHERDWESPEVSAIKDAVRTEP